MTGHLSEPEQNELLKRAAKMGTLVKAPERVSAVVQHIVHHFQDKVEPNGFKHRYPNAIMAEEARRAMVAKGKNGLGR